MKWQQIHINQKIKNHCNNYKVTVNLSGIIPHKSTKQEKKVFTDNKVMIIVNTYFLKILKKIAAYIVFINSQNYGPNLKRVS